MGDNDDTVTSPSHVDLGIPGLVDAALIGTGGFGAVYRARQPRLNRMVAAKVLSTVLDGPARERFEREGFAMGTLAGHPHILEVHSVGATATGRPYLLMPYVEGGSLAGRVPLSWPAAVTHIVKISGALETAHRAGVLHRDVKPTNILVSRFGEPLLADFGIARVVGAFETTDGRVSASVHYAAPEVLDGKAVSPAADVYALAATLFCLLTGHPPFAGEPGEELLSTYVRIHRGPVPDLRPSGVPDALCAVLERALAKDPRERPQTAGGFGVPLQDVLRAQGRTPPAMALPADDADTNDADTDDADTNDAEEAPAPPSAVAAPRPRRRVRIALAASVGVVVLAAAAITVPLLRPDATPEATPDPTRTRPAVPVTLAVSDPADVAVAADGAVYVADPGAHRVHLIAPDGKVATFAGTGTAGTAGDGGPAAAAELTPEAVAVAPDGSVYISTEGGIRVVARGGRILTLTNSTEYFRAIAIAITADGDVYAADDSTIRRVLPDGRTRVIAPAAGGSKFVKIADVVADRSGALLVSDSEADRIYRVTADGQRRVFAGGGAAAPDRDGQRATATHIEAPTGLAIRAGRVYFSEGGANRIRVIGTDGTVRTIAGDPEQYSEGNSGDGGPARSARFLLFAGRLAFGPAGELYVADEGNGRVRVITPRNVVEAFGT